MKFTGYLSALAALLLLSHQVLAEPEQVYSPGELMHPELAKTGSHKVGVITLTRTNPNQLIAPAFAERGDRSLTLEVWYPAAADTQGQPAVYSDKLRTGRDFSVLGTAVRGAKSLDSSEAFPLVVISHGYTGYRSQMFYMGEHLASHGYVVVAIDHTDSTNADIAVQENKFAGFPSTLYYRSRDQQFVLDSIAATGIEGVGKIDTDRASLFGFSMGGYGAMATVGGCYAFSDAFLAGFPGPDEYKAHLKSLFSFCAAGREQADPRWKAALAFAPWGAVQGLHDLDALAKVKVPTLFIAGDHDDVSGYKKGVHKLYESFAKGKSHILIFENARHNLGIHPAPKSAYDNDYDLGHYLEPVWQTEVINQVTEHFALAFLNCHVKDDKSACAYRPDQESATDADGKTQWKGFPERFALGMRFKSNR